MIDVETFCFGLSSNVMVPLPSIETLSIDSKPSNDFNLSSCLMIISLSISSGLAPDHDVDIEISGFSTVGTSCMGTFTSDISPNIKSNKKTEIIVMNLFIE